MPPKPVVIAAGAGAKLGSILVLMVLLPCGAEPKLMLGAGVGNGVPGAVGFTAAPASFSCVRPNAAIPSTAPMAMWNRPAPCSVSGCHCVIAVF